MAYPESRLNGILYICLYYFIQNNSIKQFHLPSELASIFTSLVTCFARDNSSCVRQWAMAQEDNRLSNRQTKRTARLMNDRMTT